MGHLRTTLAGRLLFGSVGRALLSCHRLPGVKQREGFTGGLVRYFAVE
jgi:hypothetical protein